MDANLMNALMKEKETLVLKKAVSLDELFGLMEKDKGKFPAKFRLQKGLFGAAIVFDESDGTAAEVKVKETTVTVKRKDRGNVTGRGSKGSRMRIGEMSDFVKTAKSAINTVNADNEGDDYLAAKVKYFQGICEVMRGLLANHLSMP